VVPAGLASCCQQWQIRWLLGSHYSWVVGVGSCQGPLLGVESGWGTSPCIDDWEEGNWYGLLDAVSAVLSSVVGAQLVQGGNRQHRTRTGSVWV
jgi:hypothetical protein